MCFYFDVAAFTLIRSTGSSGSKGLSLFFTSSLLSGFNICSHMMAVKHQEWTAGGKREKTAFVIKGRKKEEEEEERPGVHP